MVSASDIITFIGVPLAVLGVMPILYTFSSALYTKLRINRALRKDDIEAMVSSRLMSGIVEAQLPLYELRPYPRTKPSYWKEHSRATSVQAAEWRSYHWIRRPIANDHRTLRFQRGDSIRLPEARIDFDALVCFLLDIGASICSSGFRSLRNSGLDVPGSTPLLELNSENKTSIPLLTVAKLSTSIGNNLNLELHQPSTLFKHNKRNAKNVLPGWLLVSDITSSPSTGLSQESTGETGSTDIQEHRPERQQHEQRATLVRIGGPDTRFPPELGEVYLPSVSGSNTHRRKWLNYVLLAAMYESEEKTRIKIEGIPYRLDIEPEVILLCRTFALPAKYTARWDVFDLPTKENYNNSIQPDTILEQLQQYVPSWLRDQVFNIRKTYLGYDSAKHLFESTQKRRIMAMIYNKEKGYLPIRALSIRDSSSIDKISRKALQKPSFREELEKELERCLESLYGTFTSDPENYDLFDRPDRSIFKCALAVIQAIGRHAEQFLAWSDVEVCLQKYPIANLS